MPNSLVMTKVIDMRDSLKKFPQGGFVPKKDGDEKKVLLSRGWWKCKKCGALFEDYTDPPFIHYCEAE